MKGLPTDVMYTLPQACCLRDPVLPALLLPVCLSALSLGAAVTKSLSGAARATIDACRTVFIWLYALHAGWESFHALEVVGFVVLISGTSLYNEIIKSCLPGVGACLGVCVGRGGEPARRAREAKRQGRGRALAR